VTKAVVLLSGGLDSATALAEAKAAGFECYALSFDYGQRHTVELDAARRVATATGVADHVVSRIDLRRFGGSALTSDVDVPKGREVDRMAEGIPITYVPARNTVFLSFALAWAETLPAADIFIGINAVDFSGYPDCRPAFLRAFEEMANLATRLGTEGETRVKIHAPFMSMNKAEIIARGVELGVDYAITSTCYDPTEQGKPCGACDACLLRAKGFAEAGLADPLLG
jgi:7-cyano-7-deazaguanine synthase